MPGRFQLSLRALLLVLTAACLYLGWRVERTRQRQAAIDAISRHALVQYRGSSQSVSEGTDHFWLDWQTVPVSVIGLRESPPSKDVGKHLSHIPGLADLDLREWFDTDLRLIESLDDGCAVLISEMADGEARERLRRKLPRCHVSSAPRDNAE